MPNKTIYIKDADLPLWEKAQKQLGESISSVFIDYLKERLDTQKRRAGKVDEVEAMNKLLSEVNADLNLDVELHPFWRYPILDQNSVNHGYKIHRKNADPDRIMSLIVWPLDFADDGAKQMLKERITSEIRQFWNGRNTELHTLVDTTVDPLAR